MPRLNNNIPPKTKSKFDSISLKQSEDYWHGEIYVMQPLGGANSSEGGNENFTTGLQYQNFLNTTLREGVSTRLKVPLKTADKLSTSNGTIRYRIISGSKAPLSTQTKGTNTLEWMQNNRNIKLELETALPDKDVQYMFYFEDPSKNQVPIIEGESAQKVSARTYYKTSESPKIDHLSSDKEIVGQYIELTGALEVWLQNDETGANLFIDYITQPAKPANAKYMILEIESMCLLNSIEATSSGSPINVLAVDKLNASSLGVDNIDFISDDWFLDLSDPRDSLNGNSKKPLWRSTMSGEIHNKYRIWETVWTDIDKNGHFGIPNVQATAGTWDQKIPGRNYRVFSAGTAPVEFSDEILDLFKFDNERNGIKSWYNTFSFFENVYGEGGFGSANVGEVEWTRPWKSSNGYLIFDVQKADVIDSQFGAGLQEGLCIQEPGKFNNPNYSDEDYAQFIRDAITGTVNINGTTFSGWVNTLEPTPKDDKIYNWENNAENKKYLVLTPKINIIDRYKLLLKNGGQISKDNNTNVKVGKTQIVDARHPFPTGDGSVDIHYDSNIWYDASIAAAQGWPTNNKIVVTFGSERVIDKILLNVFAGIKYRLSFYDSKFKPAVGIDKDGKEVELPPTIIAAGNVDITNDPLKASVEIIFGITSSYIL